MNRNKICIPILCSHVQEKGLVETADKEQGELRAPMFPFIDFGLVCL